MSFAANITFVSSAIYADCVLVVITLNDSPYSEVTKCGLVLIRVAIAKVNEISSRAVKKRLLGECNLVQPSRRNGSTSAKMYTLEHTTFASVISTDQYIYLAQINFSFLDPLEPLYFNASDFHCVT